MSTAAAFAIAFGGLGFVAACSFLSFASPVDAFGDDSLADDVASADFPIGGDDEMTSFGVVPGADSGVDVVRGGEVSCSIVFHFRR